MNHIFHEKFVLQSLPRQKNKSLISELNRILRDGSLDSCNR